MDKTQKQETVDRLHQVFSENNAVLLIDFTGINVAAETELRRKVAESGQYQVVKNTLALRAAQETPVALVSDHFRGPTAIAFTRQDPVGLAKALKILLKDNPQMTFKAAVVDEQGLTGEQVMQLAEMPGREELVAKLMGLLQAPVQQLAGALQSPLTKLALLLKQVAEGKQE